MSNAREIMAEKLGVWRASGIAPRESVTHVAAGTETSTGCTAIIYRGEIQEEPYGDGRFLSQRYQLTILRTELAAVAVNDIFTVPALSGSGTESITVKNITFENSALIECIAYRQIRKGLADQGDQRQRQTNRAALT